MMRKILYMMGTAVCVFLVSIINVKADVYFTNREGIEMTETEYNNLLNLAFSEEQIDRMDYQTFIDNKDLEGEIVAQERKLMKITTTIQNGIKTYTYTEVTENEALLAQQMQTLGPGYSPNVTGTFYDGFSNDEFRDMQTYIICLYDTYMRYKVDVQWVTIPSERSWDIIGIGIEQNKVHIVSSIGFRADWKTGNGNFEHTLACGTQYEDTGGSATFELPTGSLQSLEAYSYFNVYKNQNVGTLYGIVAVGDYAHATDTVNFNTLMNGTYEVTIYNGIDVDTPYANSYVSSLTSDATFVGEW